MFAVGDRLGAYVIRRRIGEGGMGEVYLAEHVHISRKAAIKVLLPELSSRPDIVGRFFNEARATGSLRHPNIVEILDCDVHTNGRAYIVMEFLEGETLGQSLARIGSLAGDAATAAAIAGQIAGGLAASHGKGIVHRDLKPDNIFLASPTDGESPVRVKILDFGIAKLLGEGASQSRKTRTGSVLGTPVYMSPEQCRGAGHVDHRSDLYSLGCIIFEMLAGQPPFVREGHGELIIAHNSEPPPELASVVPSVPPALASLVAQMLVKDPSQRTQTMADVVSSIESILRVPSTQFARCVKPPAGFPAGGAEEPEPAPLPFPTADPLPRTLVQATPSQTKVLPNRGTTLSQAAIAAPEAAPRPPARSGLKIGIGVTTLAAAAAVVLMIFLRRPAPQVNEPEPAPPASTVSPPPVVAVPSATPRAPGDPATTAARKAATPEVERALDAPTVASDGQPAAVPIVVPAGPKAKRSDRRQAHPTQKVRPAHGKSQPPAAPNEKDDAFRDL